MKSVGVLGIGSIADVYVRNAARMKNYRVVAVAGRDPELTRRRASEWGTDGVTPAKLLNRPDIDIVLNLTPPAAHFETTKAALLAGKHVFSEKVLGVNLAEARELTELARQLGLRLAVAPDAILGAGLQAARAMIDAGTIGRPIFATAAICYHGADDWHPNPSFFYKTVGGGPMHDVGPYFLAALVALLGPIERVTATSTKGFETRRMSAPGREQGLEVTVEAPTTVLALAQFRSGAQASLMASWDVWQTSQPDLEIHGTTGSLSLPHPNWHGGPLRHARGKSGWDNVPLGDQPLATVNWPPEAPQKSNYRGIGIAEMIEAIDRGVPHRASAELAEHVVEACDAIVASAASGQSVRLDLTPARPEPFGPVDAARLLIPSE